MLKSSFEILNPPEKPTFRTALKGTWGKGISFLGNPILALALALLNFVVDNITVRTILNGLLILVGLAVILVISLYIRDWALYYKKMETNLLSLRGLLLRESGIRADSRVDFRWDLAGIREIQGTVALVIRTKKERLLGIGSLLNVVTSVGEVWGSVKVVESGVDTVAAVPRDRDNVQFWEGLEDRMKKDPSPPQDIHLEPYINPFLRTSFEQVENEEGAE